MVDFETLHLGRTPSLATRLDNGSNLIEQDSTSTDGGFSFLGLSENTFTLFLSKLGYEQAEHTFRDTGERTVLPDSNILLDEMIDQLPGLTEGIAARVCSRRSTFPLRLQQPVRNRRHLPTVGQP